MTKKFNKRKPLKSKFNPDSDYIDSAVKAFIKSGGKITTVTEEDVRRSDITLVGPWDRSFESDWHQGAPKKDFQPKTTIFGGT